MTAESAVRDAPRRAGARHRHAGPESAGEAHRRRRASRPCRAAPIRRSLCTPAGNARRGRRVLRAGEAAIARSSRSAQRLERVRLVAMDMDSTLITIECIDEIADMHGHQAEVAAITASAMRGEIDFRESLTRRVALLAGCDVAALERVYDERLRLSPGRRAHAGRRSARVGAKSLLVSGGFTFFTDRLQDRLGLDHTLCEHAGDRRRQADRAPDRATIVDAEAKAARVRAPARDACRGDDGLSVAIGDGANDLPMLDAADVSVAYRAKPVVRARATYAIDHCGLDAVLNLFA